MAIDFTTLESTIQQTKLEVAEHEQAVANLGAANATLSAAQAEVAGAELAVAAAAAETEKQLADVLAGIDAAITTLQELQQNV